MRTIEIFIPGKIMLAGEYSVLHAGHALAATLTCGMNIKVEWHPHAAQWEIHSNLWTEPKFVADNHSPQLDMLCRAVQYAAKRSGMHGGTVRVASDLDPSSGIGSSSAIRLGICGAFLALKNDGQAANQTSLPQEAIHGAWVLQSEGQGAASGYDIVTQFAGGLIEFDFETIDQKWRPSWFRHEMNGLSDLVHVFVGGKGAPTTKTITSTSTWLEFGNRFDRLMETSESLVDAFNLAIKWPSVETIRKLSIACGATRKLFSGSPYFPTRIAEKLEIVPGLDKNWSWKTTGAGGEDALLLIGTRHSIRPAMMALLEMGWHPIDFSFSTTAAHITASTRDDSDGLPHDSSLTVKTPVAASTPGNRRAGASSKLTFSGERK